MKFTVTTKPFQDVLDLVVVQGNISKFYAKSTILQISVDTKGVLVLNSEADSVVSEARLKGSVDKIENATTFVDAVLFKQLVGTLDTPTIELDFVDQNIVIRSGRSTFTISSVVQSSDMQLRTPAEPSGSECDLNASNWKQVKDKQMYAISENFVKLVYTYVFNGTNEVIVGDYTSSLFTRSELEGLPVNCLLSSNIIGVILSVDSKSKIYHVGTSFILVSSTDAYEFTSELTPKYESEPEIGSYNSEAISSLFVNASSDGIIIPIFLVKQLLSQTNLLADGLSPTIKFSCSGNSLSLTSDKVDGVIEGKLIGDSRDWELEFKLKDIMSVISNLSGEVVGIYPGMLHEDGEDDIITSLVFKDEDVSVVLASIDE